ncbi:MAG: hypothetical protein ACR2NP_22030 [Pirellulaceae bacterium]
MAKVSSALNLRRGLLMAAIWTVIGFVVPVLLMTIYLQVTWWIHETPQVDRQLQTSQWLAKGIMPLIGSSFFLGLAALATWTPRNYRGFADTLALLFLVSLAAMWIASTLNWLPRRPRGARIDLVSVELLIFVFVPVLIVAVILVGVRVARDAGPMDDDCHSHAFDE